MSFDEAVSTLRGWVGDEVAVRLEPETTELRGRLAEREEAEPDSAFFSLAGETPTGVAFALFRDAARTVRRDDERLVVQQGEVTVTVTRAG